MDRASHQKVYPGAGEVAEKLGVLPVFAEDSVSIASTYVRLTTTPAPGDPTHSFDLLGILTWCT